MSGFPELPAHADVGWKPHPQAYRYAAEVLGVPVDRLARVVETPGENGCR